MSPRQPIKLRDSTNQLKRFRLSHMKHGGHLNKHICEKKNQISPVRQQKLSISTFPIISLGELQVAIATRVLIRPE